MADSVGSVSLKMILDSKEFKAQVNKEVKGSLSQIDASQRKITSSAKTATSFLGKEISALSKLGSIAKGLIATLGVGLSVAGITSFAKECTKLGSDLAEVQNVVDVVYGNMSDSVNKFAASAIKTYGMSETKAKEYMGTLGAMSKAFGNSQSEAYAQAETLTKMAGDMASFYNKSTDETFTALKAVYSGETEVLKQYGVVMTEAALNEYAMQQGIGKTVKQMSEQEKVSLRLSFVQDKLSDSAGDFSRTSGSWANQVRVLQLQFESFKATIGQGLINVLTPIVQWLNSIMEAANGAAQAFSNFTASIMGISSSGSGGAGATLAESTAAAAESASEVNDGIKAAGGSAKKATKQLAGFDKLNILTKNSGGGGGGGGAATKSKAADADTSKVSSVAENLKKAFDIDPRSLGTTIGTKLKGAMDNIPWKVIQSKVNGGVSKVAQFINGFFQTPGLFASAGKGLAESLNTITSAIDTFFRETEFFENAKSIGEGFTSFVENIDFGKVASAITGVLKSLPETISGFLAGVDWSLVGKSIYNGIKNFLKNFDLAGIQKSLGKVTGYLIKAVFGLVKGIGKETIVDIKKYFQTHSPLEIAKDVLSVLSGKALLSWFLDNVTFPFIEGVLGAFGASEKDLAKTTAVVKELLTNPFSLALKKIKEIFNNLAIWFDTNVIQPIVAFFEPIIETVSSIFDTLLNIIVGIWATVAEWFDSAVIQPTIDFFEPIIEKVSGFFSDLWEDIKNVWTTVSTWFDTNVIQPVTGFFEDVWTDVSGYFSSLWDDICEVWEDASTWFTDNVIDPIVDAFEGIADSIKEAFNSVLDSVESTINNILSGLNSFIDKINSFGEKGASLIGTEYTAIPKFGEVTIPRLAQGGFVKANTPQLAMIGDNRTQGEFVAPEDKLQAAVVQAMMMAMPKMMQMMNQRSNMALAGGGDINVNCTAEIDGEVLFDIVEKVKNRRNKRSGGNL